MEREEGLDLTNDLAAGAVWLEDLIKEPEKGAAYRIDALSAVSAFIGLSQQAGRQ
jgi:hypothetical protein